MWTSVKMETLCQASVLIGLNTHRLPQSESHHTQRSTRLLKIARTTSVVPSGFTKGKIPSHYEGAGAYGGRAVLLQKSRAHRATAPPSAPGRPPSYLIETVAFKRTDCHGNPHTCSPLVPGCRLPRHQSEQRAAGMQRAHLCLSTPTGLC